MTRKKLLRKQNTLDALFIMRNILWWRRSWIITHYSWFHQISLLFIFSSPFSKMAKLINKLFGPFFSAFAYCFINHHQDHHHHHHHHTARNSKTRFRSMPKARPLSLQVQQIFISMHLHTFSYIYGFHVYSSLHA